MVELMEAVETLEISTRLSKSCCEAFADAGAPEILYNLIRTCNRSLPHIELLQLVLATLENVSSYPKLIPNLATDNSVDILIDLIQMFRDKEVILWLSAHLLWVILCFSEKLLVSVEDLFFYFTQLRPISYSNTRAIFISFYDHRTLLLPAVKT
jgi:abnormal spindle-like microcephaly-associated protein